MAEGPIVANAEHVEVVADDFNKRIDVAMKETSTAHEANGVTRISVYNGIINSMTQGAAIIYATFLKQLGYPPEDILSIGTMHFSKCLAQQLKLDTVKPEHLRVTGKAHLKQVLNNAKN